MGRTLVMGDIHGSAKALEQVLERAGVTEDDKLIQLGDVADGWSQTAECVEILNGLKNKICIRGNHDVWVYDWINQGVQHNIWTSQGGRATIDSYVNCGALMDRKHQDFWNNQVDWYIDDDDRLFIHAGWAYTYKPEEYYVHKLSKRELFEYQASKPVSSYGKNVIGSIAKECHWDRDVLMGAKSGSVKNSETKQPSGFNPLKIFKEVYIGHTASRDGLPHNFLNLWQMDTGCGWHGKLTIMDVDTKEYWQSDYSNVLYPDEKGR